jgi:hypothetical protein
VRVQLRENRRRRKYKAWLPLSSALAAQTRAHSVEPQPRRGVHRSVSCILWLSITFYEGVFFLPPVVKTTPVHAHPPTHDTHTYRCTLRHQSESKGSLRRLLAQPRSFQLRAGTNALVHRGVETENMERTVRAQNFLLGACESWPERKPERPL